MAQRLCSNRRQPSNALQRGKTTSLSDTTTRVRDLAHLLPLWTVELNDMSPAGRLKILVKLRRALRTERLNGTNGHWSYDLARHKALLDAYRREVDFVRSQNRADTAVPLCGTPKNK